MPQDMVRIQSKLGIRVLGAERVRAANKKRNLKFLDVSKELQLLKLQKENEEKNYFEKVTVLHGWEDTKEELVHTLATILKSQVNSPNCGAATGQCLIGCPLQGLKMDQEIEKMVMDVLQMFFAKVTPLRRL